MTMTEQIQKKKKIASEYQQALDSLNLDFEKLQEKVDRVFRIGRENKFSDMRIGQDIRKKMKEHYSHDTIHRVFKEYPEAQYKSRGSNLPQNAVKNGNKDSKKGPSKHNSICPECGKSSGDSLKGFYQMPIDQFKLEEIDSYDRAYVIHAVEHFYAEMLKWKSKYEELLNKETKAKPKSKPKGIGKMGDEQKKKAATMKFLSNLGGVK